MMVCWTETDSSKRARSWSGGTVGEVADSLWRPAQRSAERRKARCGRLAAAAAAAAMVSRTRTVTVARCQSLHHSECEETEERRRRTARHTERPMAVAMVVRMAAAAVAVAAGGRGSFAAVGVGRVAGPSIATRQLAVVMLMRRRLPPCSCPLRCRHRSARWGEAYDPHPSPLAAEEVDAGGRGWESLGETVSEAGASGWSRTSGREKERTRKQLES